MDPGGEAFDFPAAAGAPQGAPILRRRTTAPAMPGDHLDLVALAQRRIQRVAIVAAGADQAQREFREEARVERGRDKMGLMR
jgi:hypothetical protein